MEIVSTRDDGNHRHIIFSMISILNDHLCVTKLFASWVPHLLTFDHKCNFERVINVVQAQSGHIFATSYNRRGNMNSSQSIGDLAPVETVVNRRRRWSKWIYQTTKSWEIFLYARFIIHIDMLQLRSKSVANLMPNYWINSM